VGGRRHWIPGPPAATWDVGQEVHNTIFPTFDIVKSFGVEALDDVERG
jgi:hypothetical protein